MGAVRRALPLILWGVALALGTALFHGLGSGALEAPPLEPSGWEAWADGKDPLVATVAVLRLVVLALSWYLVGATTIGIVARLLRAARLVRLADALTVPVLRRLLQGALGLSLATAMVAAAVPGGTLGTARPGTVATATSDRSAATLSVGSDGDPDRVTLASPGQPATLYRVADEQAPGGAGTGEGADSEVTLGHAGSDRLLPLELTHDEVQPPDHQEASDGQAPPAAGPGPDGVGVSAHATASPAPDTHEVVTGESLWGIARNALADAWGRPPSDAEVVGYWRELIDTNRSALEDPDNPDLIFPGQVFTLPPMPDA